MVANRGASLTKAMGRCRYCGPDTQRAEHLRHRRCLACDKPLPDSMRASAEYCNSYCRFNSHQWERSKRKS